MGDGERVLITGATGLVGSRLLSSLSATGHRCEVLSRSPGRAAKRLPLAAACRAWDPQGGPPPREALAGVRAVVHLAGESVVGRWTRAKRRAIRESRVAGTRHLVEGLRALPPEERPETLVSASAIGYYGDRGDERLDEASLVGDDFLAGVCRDWEAAARGAEELGLRVVRLRIGLVLDPEGGALGAMLRPFKLGLGGPLGNGRQWWSWIHLHDLVRLVERALVDTSWSGAFAAAAPDPRRQAEFAACLARALGRWSVLPGPKTALQLVLGGFAQELLASRRVLPSAAQAAGFAFEHPELEAALADLLQAVA